MKLEKFPEDLGLELHQKEGDLGKYTEEDDEQGDITLLRRGALTKDKEEFYQEAVWVSFKSNPESFKFCSYKQIGIR